MLARYNNNCYWLATTTLSLQRVTDLSFATCFPVAPQLASACSHLLTSATIGAWRLPISADNRHSVNAPLEFKGAKDKCRTEKCPRNKANYQKKCWNSCKKNYNLSPSKLKNHNIFSTYHFTQQQCWIKNPEQTWTGQLINWSTEQVWSSNDIIWQTIILKTWKW